jgi:transcription antitermination factor NusG
MYTQEQETTGNITLDVREWCAVHTRYQHEHLVNDLLVAKGFETFFPTFQRVHAWKDRKKTISHALFPGYLFVINTGDSRLPIISTPGVCGLVSVAGVPATIPNDEIETIRRAISGPYAVTPHPYLKRGDRVQVCQGPLTGIRGILVRTEKLARLVLTIELLGRAVAVEIESSCVEPLGMTVPAQQHS